MKGLIEFGLLLIFGSIVFVYFPPFLSGRCYTAGSIESTLKCTNYYSEKMVRIVSMHVEEFWKSNMVIEWWMIPILAFVALCLSLYYVADQIAGNTIFFLSSFVHIFAEK